MMLNYSIALQLNKANLFIKKMKTIIYRFSEKGFESKEQNFHAMGLEISLQKHKIDLYKKNHQFTSESQYLEFVLPEWKEFTKGIFAFIGQLPSESTLRTLTNHLDRKQHESFSWWTGEIDIQNLAFDANNLWNKKGILQIEELLLQNKLEIFLPEQFMKISNIQQWSNNFNSIYHISDENLLIPQQKQPPKFFKSRKTI